MEKLDGESSFAGFLMIIFALMTLLSFNVLIETESPGALILTAIHCSFTIAMIFVFAGYGKENNNKN